MNWNYWMLHTARHEMRFHWSRRTSIIKSLRNLSAKERRQKNIAEAMGIIREWNPHFMLRYFMTDYSNEEIKATVPVFQVQ